jgi:antitoxin component YwqK of YwqJK toxin-antitoxin module
MIEGCHTDNIRRIPLNGRIAEGVFLPGDVLNGRVNFYDSATSQLVEFANYNNGKLDGRRELLYSNGNTRVSVDYSNDKENGFVVMLDSFGNMKAA